MAGIAVPHLPASAAVAAPSAPPARAPQILARIGDTRLNIADETEAVTRIVADAKAGRGGTVFTLNLDHLVKLETDPAFRAAYDRATYVTADGAPVVMMARRAGASIDRVTGADLVVPLCRAAAEAKVPVHFFGTTDAVLERSSARLRLAAPALVVAGTESPPFGFDPFGPFAREAAERIAASGASICFVALGAPKQELFASAATAWSPGVVYVCIGAALDFLGGGQRRAPRLLQESGLEWLWRLAHDPRRLTGRYARSALYLVRYMARRAGMRIASGARTLGAGLAREFKDPTDRS